MRLTIARLLRSYGLSPDRLAKDKVVGDFCYCLFDKFKNDEPWRYFVTIGEYSRYSGIDFYRNLVDRKRPVMVMAGHKKWNALIPAIRTRMFNVLITDYHTAKLLLDVDTFRWFDATQSLADIFRFDD
jgi:DNA-binding transcriptional regulator LsrR (DeoR family)